jgi:hypothetical protein
VIPPQEGMEGLNGTDSATVSEPSSDLPF